MVQSVRIVGQTTACSAKSWRCWEEKGWTTVGSASPWLISRFTENTQGGFTEMDLSMHTNNERAARRYERIGRQKLFAGCVRQGFMFGRLD
jgi:hypothetical protein